MKHVKAVSLAPKKALLTIQPTRVESSRRLLRRASNPERGSLLFEP